MPADVNWNGDIFGGYIMANVDVAGAIIAMKKARGKVATIAVNSFTFKQPVSVGDQLSFYCTIKEVGKTSITVHVDVIAERNPESPVTVRVTDATLTYVAIDENGHKRMIDE
jgi:acyl-CoA thioesterase YciA